MVKQIAKDFAVGILGLILPIIAYVLFALMIVVNAQDTTVIGLLVFALLLVVLIAPVVFFGAWIRIVWRHWTEA